MSASRGASHDHWVCTWLSIGGDQFPPAVDGSAGRSDGTCEGCCAGGTAGSVLLMSWLIASPRAYRGTGVSWWRVGPGRAGPCGWLGYQPPGSGRGLAEVMT